MNKSKVREIVTSREQEFGSWFRTAFNFAQLPVTQLKSWNELPPFPTGCNLGYELTKTTLRIRPDYLRDKQAFLLLLASFIHQRGYELYDDTMRMAYAADPETGAHCVGIVKQVAKQIGIYWFCMTIDGNLVNIECHYAGYEADLPLKKSPDEIEHKKNAERMLSGLVRQYHVAWFWRWGTLLHIPLLVIFYIASFSAVATYRLNDEKDQVKSREEQQREEKIKCTEIANQETDESKHGGRGSYHWFIARNRRADELQKELDSARDVEAKSEKQQWNNIKMQ